MKKVLATNGQSCFINHNKVKTSFNINIITFFYAAIAGVAAYNNHKLKKEASRASVNDSEQVEFVPVATNDREHAESVPTNSASSK